MHCLYTAYLYSDQYTSCDPSQPGFPYAALLGPSQAQLGLSWTPVGPNCGPYGNAAWVLTPLPVTFVRFMQYLHYTSHAHPITCTLFILTFVYFLHFCVPVTFMHSGGMTVLQQFVDKFSKLWDGIGCLLGNSSNSILFLLCRL